MTAYQVLFPHFVRFKRTRLLSDGLPLHELPYPALRRLTHFTAPNDNLSLLCVNRSGNFSVFKFIDNSNFCQLTVEDDSVVALHPSSHALRRTGSTQRRGGRERIFDGSGAHFFVLFDGVQMHVEIRARRASATVRHYR